MAANIKGITIEIGGDTTKLDKALSGVNKNTRSLQTELKQKNEQIASLQKLLDQEQQLRMVEHKRVLELEEKAQTVEEPTEPEKKSWWKKIFS